MLNPWVSLRRDQLIPVNKAVNEKEQLEEEDKKITKLAEIRRIWPPCAPARRARNN
jgi:hypothetical protein